MPLNAASAGQQAAMTAVDMDGVLAIVPVGARLTDFSWKEVNATLQQRTDLRAMAIVFGDRWLTQLFVETWNELPNRLASLAVRPPSEISLTFNRSFDWRQVAERVPITLTEFPSWWHLVDLAKRGPCVEVRMMPIEYTSAAAMTAATERDESWLPELLSVPPRRELDWLFQELRLARLSDLCGDVVSPADATAVLAGLWLLHGDADASHRQSQSIEDEGRHRCGNFWHAIMHRQEPDYGNSKYWFRRVGQHPIFPELARRADELILADDSEAAGRWRTNLGTPNGWNAPAFVDWCEAAAREGDARQSNLIRRIQFVEMHLLLRASFEDATRS